jgi:cardiolipin synthase
MIMFPHKLKFTDRVLAATLLPLIPRKVTPNQLTVLRFFMVPIILWFLFLNMYGWGCFFFTLAILTDALDGALARARDQITEWGKLFDPLADKLLIATVGTILILDFLNKYVLIGVLVVEFLLVSYSALLVKKTNKRIRGAHISGKIKMILQSVGMIGLFIEAMYPLFIPIELLYGTFYLAIAFGMASLFVYKSI